MKDHLTESEMQGAKIMGISSDEMFERLQRLEDDHIFTISIIIPVYNGEKYIKECVDSALNQTVKNVEVIVIDDGSTDKTLKILTEITGITVLIKNNGGTASALNIGIRNAKGVWIHWLSADDVLYHNAIENMLKFTDDKDIIYYSNYDIIDADSNIMGEFIEPLHRNFSTKDERFKELLGNYYGNGSSSMIHKDTFEKIKFDETLAHSEDYDFMLHAMKEGYDMKLVPVKTLKYRRHKDQMTNTVGGSLSEFIRNRYR